MIKIHGIGLDEKGRCTHYHKRCDVVALMCSACGKYYACFECHDTCEDHPFQATGLEVEYPVICGNCGKQLTRKEYERGNCIYCGIEFNAGCKRHAGIYFR